MKGGDFSSLDLKDLAVMRLAEANHPLWGGEVRGQMTQIGHEVTPAWAYRCLTKLTDVGILTRTEVGEPNLDILFLPRKPIILPIRFPSV